MQKYVVGKAYRFEDRSSVDSGHEFSGVMNEISRLENALAITRAFFEHPLSQIQSDTSVLKDMLTFYLSILDDHEMRDEISEHIRQTSVSAEVAIQHYFSQYIANIALKSAYLQERISDFEDIKARLIDALSGNEFRKTVLALGNRAAIIFFDGLKISDLVRVDIRGIAGVVAKSGGYNSHAAIILGSNDVPLVICDYDPLEIETGNEVLIDLVERTVIKNPTAKQVSKIRNIAFLDLSHPDGIPHNQLGFLRTHAVKLYPAINSPADIFDKMFSKTEGIGLFRTEFMVFERGHFLGEVDQYLSYRQLIQNAEGKPVYFRLIDIEPDKTMDQVTNGHFGVQFLLHNEEILKRQLMALIKLSMEKPVNITIPMVDCQKDIDGIRLVVEKCKQQILQNYPYATFALRIGIMAESVAITHIIRKITRIDFVQIGSNDLLAGLFELNRTGSNFKTELFMEPLFLRMVKRIIDDAQFAGFELFLCGEAANEPKVVLVMNAMGVRNFVPAINKVAYAFGSFDERIADDIRTSLSSLLALDNASQVIKKLGFL